LRRAKPDMLFARGGDHTATLIDDEGARPAGADINSEESDGLALFSKFAAGLRRKRCEGAPFCLTRSVIVYESYPAGRQLSSCSRLWLKSGCLNVFAHELEAGA
jgi:hypothetical protein